MVGAHQDDPARGREIFGTCGHIDHAGASETALETIQRGARERARIAASDEADDRRWSGGGRRVGHVDIANVGAAAFTSEAIG
ncbi:MAG: hypothetical protein JNL07_04595 [Rhodospirillales bacterium]|nr:hypothetical protein [Rhodospirillales bacterium]